jgi:hypothetical protein
MLLVSLVPGIAAAQPPGNDDVGSATAVTAIPFEDTVEVGEATIQEGEPTETCAPFANTVWYSLTLAETTEVFIDTAGSNYDTTVAVWVGSSFDDVELVACNDDTFFGLQAATSVTVEAGVTYLVQVGAFSEAPPDAVLTISFGEPPKSTGKPFIVKDSFRGRMADAFLEQFDEETGTFSFQAVNLVDGRSQGKGSKPFRVREVFVESFEETFDEATETFSFTQWFGGAELNRNDFSIDPQLEEAWVTKELTLFGQTCTDSPEGFECTELGEALVLVDVMWDGDGPVVKMRDRSSESSDGFRLRFRGTSRTRNAVVGGGVSGDLAFDLAGAAGSISKNANGFWLWARGAGAGFFGFAGATQALAETGLVAAADVVVDRFRGQFASAFQEEFNEETGEFSFRDVSLAIGRTKTKGQKWFAFEEISVSSFTEQFDEEAGSVTFTDWFGSGPLIDGFVDRKLRRAEGTAEVTLFGFTCTEFFDEPIVECNELGETTVMVDVAWEGVGDTFTSRSSFDSKVTGGEHVRFMGRSTSRSAVANGVVDGDVVGWTLVDADGSLSRNADGSWFKG